MTLPASGLITAADINVELGRASNAPFSLNDPEVRALAGIATGPISFSDFHGKASEVVVTLASSGSVINMADLFTADDWANPNKKKRVVIPAGVHRGTTTLSYVLFPCPTAYGQAGSWAGDLILENHGTMSGLGGAPNSGVGGDVIYGNLPGRDGQKLIVNNYGTIRAGGGGGGRGGTGGGGYYINSYTDRDPDSGDVGSMVQPYTFWNPGGDVWWKGTLVNNGNAPYSGTFSYGGWTYHQGQKGAPLPSHVYAVYRTQVVNQQVNTNGGAGGDGGRGYGYDGANAAGSAGANGGTNAGKGGTGGTGGGYGASGNTGATGANGNRTNGLAGAAGGAAGYYIDGLANVELNNFGTVQGRSR